MVAKKMKNIKNTKFQNETVIAFLGVNAWKKIKTPTPKMGVGAWWFKNVILRF